ncbi:MAG: hypothetical protein EP332_05040 [Bacteroidetes bacterium]|nr:MAG: hypothetical protein EP332_05040 [Bacteroidota bacterium]
MNRWLIPIIFFALVSACCPKDEAPCQDDCRTYMLFVPDAVYDAEDLDTILNVYKKEGHRYADTLYHVLQPDGRYSGVHPCARAGELGLHKNISDSVSKDARVEWYRLFIGQDSFVVDHIDLSIIRSGSACSNCITSTERKFSLDGKAYFVNEPGTPSIILYKK